MSYLNVAKNAPVGHVAVDQAQHDSRIKRSFSTAHKRFKYGMSPHMRVCTCFVDDVVVYQGQPDTNRRRRVDIAGEVPQTPRAVDAQSDRHERYVPVDRAMSSHVDLTSKQTNRQTSKQTNRQINRQISQESNQRK